jgi:uncharacterized protein (TIGR00251 family)
MLKLQRTTEGIILGVNVKPCSKEFRMELDENELIVSCPEAPMKGKINKKLLKLFSRLFSRNVELVSGFTSRQKKFLIPDIEAQEVNKILVSVSGLG